MGRGADDDAPADDVGDPNGNDVEKEGFEGLKRRVGRIPEGVIGGSRQGEAGVRVEGDDSLADDVGDTT